VDRCSGLSRLKSFARKKFEFGNKKLKKKFLEEGRSCWSRSLTRSVLDREVEVSEVGGRRDIEGK